ncbi:hypothetical protein BY996DRAFT_4549417, partial [Phakopsora pachyrhizi]
SESRLYVGNLSPAVDEFSLVALFSKFGKISKLDFLFHKSGALRGKPRGYAFIEMNRKDEALKAMIELNNKPLRGRRILVTRANESQYQEHQAANQVKPNHQNRGSSSTSDGRNGPRGKGPTTDPMRPTTLSILKSQQQPKGHVLFLVNNKIAALEAKLASMQKQNDQEESPSQSEEPAASSSSLLPKPAFLPSNPLLNLNSTNPINPSMKSTTKDYRLNQSSVLSHNPEKKPVEFKNSVNLEALGLTLKEQLKRNRQSQA